MNFTAVKELVAARKKELIQNVLDLGSIPGVNPRMGGKGESKRIEWLKQYSLSGVRHSGFCRSRGKKNLVDRKNRRL